MSYRSLFVAWGIMAALLAATTVLGLILHAMKRRGRASAQILERGLPGWWSMALLLGLTLWVGTAGVLVLFALISFLAFREFVTLAPTRPGDHVALAVSFYLILPLQYALLSLGWFGLLPLVIPLYAFLVLPILAALSGDNRSLQSRAAETHWGLMLAVYCLSHVPALMRLPLPGGVDEGALLMLFLLVTVYAGDTAQLLANDLFGRHAIVARFSDGRTWEGLLAGALVAALLGAVLHRITPFSWQEAAGLALAMSPLGSLGGLVMAAIKRDHGIRDWRRGGMLDRMAPVCFSAPVFFYLVRQYGA